MIKLKHLLNEWSEMHTGPKRWFKPYGDKYTEWEKATNHTNIEHKTKPLKESNEETIEKDLEAITGEPVSISERGPNEYRAKWAYMRSELPAVEWKAAIKFIIDKGGKIDKEWTRNDYEANYEREEPAEWVPSIYFTL